MSEAVLSAIKAKFGDQVLATHTQFGDATATLDKAAMRDAATFLKHDPKMAFDMPIDVTAVDYLEYPDHDGPRFEVVYHFYSTKLNHRVRLKVGVDMEELSVPSLRPVYRGVEWFEREVWDMFGIKFEQHPDLRRILMYEEFVGHPLRKDYPLRGYQPLVPIARLDPDNEDPKLMSQDLNPDVPVEEEHV